MLPKDNRTKLSHPSGLRKSHKNTFCFLLSPDEESAESINQYAPLQESVFQTISPRQSFLVPQTLEFLSIWRKRFPRSDPVDRAWRGERRNWRRIQMYAIEVLYVFWTWIVDRGLAGIGYLTSHYLGQPFKTIPIWEPNKYCCQWGPDALGYLAEWIQHFTLGAHTSNHFPLTLPPNTGMLEHYSRKVRFLL